MWKFVMGVVLAMVCAALVVLAVLVPKLTPWAERHLRATVQRECPSCDFEMGRVGLAWDGLTVENLRLAGGEKGGQYVDFKVRRIVLSPVLSTLLSETPRLKGVTLDRPDVTFYDGEKRGRRDSGQLEAGKIVIDAIFFLEGKFTYIRDVKGTHAVLVIEEIVGDLDPNPDGARANVHARIGAKGPGFNLTIVSPWAHAPLDIATQLEVKDQSLEALSEFFKPNAGVELQGTLTHGFARTRMRGDRLTAAVRAEYEGFKLRVDKMYDRNEIQTFFTNLGAAIAMREKNKGEPRREQEATVELTRENGESIVSFILRGLKEASLKIAI